MLLVLVFLLPAGFLALTGLLSCRNIAGVLYCALFDPKRLWFSPALLPQIGNWFL